MVLGIGTILLDLAQCWDVVKNGRSLDFAVVGVVNFPAMWIAVSYMGMLNRERKDVLSAVVGDSTIGGGFLDRFFTAFFNSRAPRP